jgi:DNA-3-methyladenine glycosylase
MAPRPFPQRSRLRRPFFARPTHEVARDLVGCLLVVRGLGGPCAVRLVEVEAYLGTGEDPASHAHRGPTPRNSVMYATPGRLYVYFIYGMHWCMNVVCERKGVAGAVLLRAAEPVAGLRLMERRRASHGRAIANGPGKLCQALGIDGACNGADLTRGPIGLWPGPGPRALSRSPRIGIRQAADRPWRYFDPDSAGLSRRPRAATL